VGEELGCVDGDWHGWMAAGDVWVAVGRRLGRVGRGRGGLVGPGHVSEGGGGGLWRVAAVASRCSSGSM